MDPHLQLVVRNLERHWVALAGIAAAALLGGGAGKALSPQGLYEDPKPAQLIATPVQQEADVTPVAYRYGVPDYVMGTDATRPHEAVLSTDPAYIRAAYAPTETPDVYAHAAEAVAANAVAEADRQQDAVNVEQAASSDSTEIYPAMAPG